jgi:two-component system LytT family sensor kinase
MTNQEEIPLAEECLHRHTFWTHARDLIIVTIIGVIVTLFFTGFKMSWPGFLVNVLYCFVFGGVVWKGLEFTSHLVEKRHPWYINPSKTLYTSLPLMILFTIVWIVGFNFLWWKIVADDLDIANFWTSEVFVIMIIQFFITAFITMIFLISNFFNSTKRYIAREKQYKKEKIALEYEALKSQVNPHFLFNSLNALTSLVTKDQEASVKFIKKLSDVYRYVLESKERQLVKLSDELKFVESYIYLQKIRFEDSLTVDIRVKSLDNHVIPISLQMLVENAIKHNSILNDSPLHISISEIDDYLIVENNLQKRRTVKGETTETDKNVKLGLENLKSQYSHFANKPVIIEETKGKFIVKLPLIHKDESYNS